MYARTVIIAKNKFHAGRQGSSVNIVSENGLDDRAIEVRSPAEAKRTSPLTCVQTG
jgi:hypothetical protein